MADWDCEFNFFQGIHVKIDIRIDISISIRPMTIKFGRQIHLEQKELTQMRLIKQVLVTSSRQDYVTNLKQYTPTTRVPLATKLGRMVWYRHGLLSIKSYDFLITCSCKITWHTKTMIFPLQQITGQTKNISRLTQCLWPQNLAP